MSRDTGIAARLRAYGLNVVEINGWQTRGSSSFNPQGSVDHHTAGSSNGNAPSLGVCINGRAGLSGPLCNVLIGRDNTCYVIAAGRANHAGRGSWRGLSGNSSVYGVERENTGYATGPRAEPWRVDQHWVAACVHAALLDGKNLDNLCQHKEWTSRKIDVHSVNGDDMRTLTKAMYVKHVERLQGGPKPAPAPTPPPAAPAAPTPAPTPEGISAQEFLTNVANAAKAKPTLRRGKKGGHVKTLQDLLNRQMNNALKADGKFGMKTENVLRMYQASRNLASDGIAGYNTWAHLIAEAYS